MKMYKNNNNESFKIEAQEYFFLLFLVEIMFSRLVMIALLFSEKLIIHITSHKKKISELLTFFCKKNAHYMSFFPLT